MYTGDLQDDLYNGHGNLTHSNGNVYIGQFERNQYHGWGKISYKNIHVECQGKFVNGKRDGPMIFINNLKQCYIGNFENDIMMFMVFNKMINVPKIGKFRLSNLLSQVHYNEHLQEFNCKGYAYAS